MDSHNKIECIANTVRLSYTTLFRLFRKQRGANKEANAMLLNVMGWN
jgi:hypothetical protein